MTFWFVRASPTNVAQTQNYEGLHIFLENQHKTCRFVAHTFIFYLMYTSDEGPNGYQMKIINNIVGERVVCLNMIHHKYHHTAAAAILYIYLTQAQHVCPYLYILFWGSLSNNVIFLPTLQSYINKQTIVNAIFVYQGINKTLIAAVALFHCSFNFKENLIKCYNKVTDNK